MYCLNLQRNVLTELQFHILIPYVKRPYRNQSHQKDLLQMCAIIYYISHEGHRTNVMIKFGVRNHTYFSAIAKSMQASVFSCLLLLLGNRLETACLDTSWHPPFLVPLVGFLIFKKCKVLYLQCLTLYFDLGLLKCTQSESSLSKFVL